MTMNSKNPLAGEMDVSTILHCSGVADKKALCGYITLIRMDKMQPSFLRTVTVFYI